MTKPDSSSPKEGAPNAGCLVRDLGVKFKQEPTLEALRLEPNQGRISVATLGDSHPEALEGEVEQLLNRVRKTEGEEGCRLLQGGQHCRHCPHWEEVRHHDFLEVKQEGAATLIARRSCPTAPRYWRWHEVQWPHWVPREVPPPPEPREDGGEDHELEEEWRGQLVLAGICGASVLGAALLDAGAWRTGLHLTAYAAGGWFLISEVLEALKRGILDVHFLMLSVAAGSAAIGAWAEGAVLLFLFSLSGALEHYAMGRTHKEIRALFHQTPKTAQVLDEDGTERSVPVEDLETGHRLRIRPGEQFPVDGVVQEGETAADESMLTGESLPLEKGRADAVLGGTLNLWGSVVVSVSRPAGESSLQRIIRFIREAQQAKAPAQRFTDRFGTAYTLFILGLCTVLFGWWWLGAGLPAFRAGVGGTSAFYRAMILLVVASPCALVLSIPSAILAAVASGARRGILFRGGAAVEELAEVDLVALDKTGTLTTGQLQVDRVATEPAGREDELLALAGALEQNSSHPLAGAIVQACRKRDLTLPATEGFTSHTGAGLEGRVAGRTVCLGKPEWVQKQRPGEIGHWDDQTRGEPGLTEVWLATDGLMGRIRLRDEIRPQSAALIGEMTLMGLRPIVLTGDTEESGAQLRERLGLSEVYCGLKPEEKLQRIRDWTTEGHRVAMVGDGVNDAPALAAAHVGLAMGARGSDAALERADVVLMNDRLENVLTARRLSVRARRIIRQNLVLSLGTAGVLIVLALGGWIPLTVGVMGHEGSTVAVVLNSLRLLFPGARAGSRQ